MAGDNEDQLGYIQHLFGVASAEEEDYERAATHFSLSLSLFRRQERHFEAAYTLLSLAVIEQRQGRYTPAAAGFQQVIQELQREAGANAPTPTQAESRDVLLAAVEGQGTVQTGQGQYRAAQATLEGALAEARTVIYQQFSVWELL